jgi:asparagine synthase (glutamine-hydrolysing)
MCGVLGGVNVEIGMDLLDQIYHRGPDGQGLLLCESGPHQVTLGHRRLAIVDLSAAGYQPMSTTDKQHHIVFNGEIYNHQDLRAEISGVEFRGHSDTETLLELLADSGVAALEKLNGIFGFVFLDQVRRKLYLVRDPFGVKPLYYAVDGNRVCFASEIRPLLSLHPAGIDLDSLATLLRLRFTPSPATLFAGIRRVRPGHVVIIDLKDEILGVEELSYLSAPSQAGAGGVSFADSVTNYGGCFERAVKRQLMSDVEVGVLLSGGVDSALVAAIAQKHSAYSLKAFTVGFDDVDDAADETRDAAETAAYLGMEHLTARMGFDDFFETLQECIGIVEEPLATTSIVPMHYLSKLAGSHVKVVMSGQGADELLGGYGRYQIELYQQYIPWWLAKIGVSLTGAAGIRNERLLRGLQALASRDELTRFLTYEVFSMAEIKRLTGRDERQAEDLLQYFYQLLDCEHMLSSIERILSLELRANLPDDLLLYTDKLTMRQSLECRVPMLDTELVALIEGMPCQHRVARGRSKIVHKAFAEQVLPDNIIHRTKKGFLSPTKAWFKDSDRLRSILLDRSSSFSSYFDNDEVARVIDEHRQGYNRERHIFLLLSLKFWIDEFF